jgi:hypothetical protein
MKLKNIEKEVWYADEPWLSPKVRMVWYADDPWGKEAIIAKILSTPAGRAKLAASMTQPLR